MVESIKNNSDTQNKTVLDKKTDLLTVEEKQKCLENKQNEKNKIKECSISELADLKKTIPEIKQNTENKEVNEFFESIVNKVLSKYLNKLNSKEGIKLDMDSIYNDVLSILDSLSKSNKTDNIFLKNITYLKENFFGDKEKGKNLIKLIVDKSIGNDKNNNSIDSKNIDTYLDVFKSSILTFYDIGTNNSPDDLKKFLGEFEKIPGFNEIKNKIPDFNNIFINTLPKLLSVIPKDKLNLGLDNFFKNIKTDLLSIASINNKDKKISKEEELKIKVDLGKGIIGFIKDITNNNTELLNNKENLDNIKGLGILKNNEILSKAFDILTDSNVKPENKNIIIQKLLGIGEELLDGRTTVDKMITEIFEILKNGGLPKDKIADFIISVINTNNGEKNSETKLNVTELVNLLSENSDTVINLAQNLKDPVKEKIASLMPDLDNLKNKALGVIGLGEEKIENKKEPNDNDLLKNIIIKMLDSGNIDKIVALLGGKFSEKAKKILNTDLNEIVSNSRKEIFKNMGDLSQKNNENHKIDSSEKLEKDILKGLSNKVIDSIGKKVFQKINEGGSLKKDEIIKDVLKNTTEYINQNKESILKYISSLGIKISSKEDKEVALNMINSILSNPKLNDIISNYITEFGKNNSNKNFTEIKKYIENSIANFDISKSLSPEIIEVGLDSIDLSNIDNIINLIEKNGVKIEHKDFIKEGLTILKNNLSNKQLSSLIKSHLDILKNPNSLNNAKIGGIIKEIYNSCDKTKLINNILDSNLTKEILVKNNVNIDTNFVKKHITAENLAQIIDKNSDKIFSLEIKENDILKIINELYDSIKDKTGFIEGVSSSIKNTDKTKEKSDKSIDLSKEITNERIDFVVDLIYKTLDGVDKNGLGELLNKLIKDNGFEKLLGIKVLGKSVGENIVNILSSIPQEKLKNFLKNNKNILINLASDKTQIEEITNMGLNFIEIVDINKFRSLQNSNSKLDKLSLDLSDELQSFTKENKSEIIDLTKKGKDLYDLLQKGVKFDEDSDELKSVKDYAGKAFNLIQKLFLKINENDISGKISDEDLGESNESKLKDKIFKSFFWNNLLFGVFNPIDIYNKDYGLLGFDYFTDSSNKDNFVGSLGDVFNKDE